MRTTIILLRVEVEAQPDGEEWGKIERALDAGAVQDALMHHDVEVKQISVEPRAGQPVRPSLHAVKRTDEVEDTVRGERLRLARLAMSRLKARLARKGKGG